MANMRSPNYPAIGLGEAIKAAELIWNKEKRTPVATDVIGKAMGYKSVSGPVRTKIAALRKYGLLEHTAGGYRVSDLAMKILHGEIHSEERCNALVEAATRPEIFRVLRETHSQASDEALKSYLIVKRGFSESGAKQFIKAFRESMEVADEAGGGYTPRKTKDEVEESTMHNAENALPLKPISGIQTYTFALSPDARAELSLKGTITPDDLELLRDHIELTIKALARTAKRGEA
jgi:hypothetical protein